MIKASELMTGNLVLVDGIPVRIISIASDGVCFKARYGWLEGVATLDRVSPIPTTSEVLEKNGWRYNDIPFIDGWEQFGLTIRDGKIVCGQNIAADVSSIHRLQQFLTICGIEKEITLDGISVKEG
jgi:hypothetical protein